MNSDETNKNGQQNIPETGGESSDTTPKHTYRILGASGLAEDEEGNLYNASDLSDLYSQPKEKPSRNNLFAKVADKPKHPDWVANYDPRYCGPSFEDYINRMEEEYQKRQSQAASSTSQTKTAIDPTDSSGSISPTKPVHDDTPSEAIDEDVLTDISDEASADSWHEALSAELNKVGNKESADTRNETLPSETDQEDSTNGLEPKSQNHIVQHYSRRTIIFYIVGLVVLLCYLFLLLYKLIKEIINLFNI